MNSRATSGLRAGGIISVGAIAGQVVLGASAIWLARLYTPQDFGVMAAFMALMVPLNVAATLRYEAAIPLAANETDASAVTVAGLGITVILCAAVAIVISAAHSTIARLLHVPDLGQVLWLLPVGLFFSGTLGLFSNWAIRDKRYRALAVARASQGIAQAGTQVGFGFMGYGPVGLVLGLLARFVVGAGVLVMASRRVLSPVIGTGVRPVAAALRRHWKFAAYSGPGVFVQSLATYLPSLYLAIVFGPSFAGFYAVAQRVLEAPVTLVARALGQSFYGHLLDELGSGAGSGVALYRSFLRRVAVLGIPIAVALSLLAPMLFPVILGTHWMRAGRYVQLLGPMYLFQFLVAATAVETLSALGRQELQLALEIFRVIVTFVGFTAVSMAHGSDLAGIVVIAGTNSLVAIAYLLANDRLLHRHESDRQLELEAAIDRSDQ